MDSDSESKLSLLIYQIISLNDSTASNSEFISVTRGIYSLIKSMDLDSKRKPETESELTSLIKQIISLVSFVSDSEPDSDFKFKSLLIELVSLLSSIESDLDPKQEQLSELMLLISQVLYYLPSLASDSELLSCIVRLYSHVSPRYAEAKPERLTYIDPVLEPEAKLISLVSRFLFVQLYGLEFISTIYEIVYFLNHMDLDSQHNKPESRLMTLTTQTISFFNSMDLDSEPEPLTQLRSLIQEYNSSSDLKLKPLIHQTLWLEPEPELMSRIYQIFSLAISMDSKCQKLISLCPQLEVNLEKGKFHVTGKVEGSNKRSHCLPVFWNRISLLGKQVTHFHCFGCNGENHGTYEKAPAKIKHPLHPKHSLQFVLWRESDGNRKCYCCNVRLGYMIYCCLVCNYAMNIDCVEKPTLLSIDHSKWHEHTLSHFPRQASITCDLCALADSSSPFYVCLLCDFVVHQSCLSLPHVMRISRHPHRISFTPSFDQLGSWSCGVCRRDINNDYGGYSCIKDGCSYSAHSKCATQSNLWDGIELEGEPEETEVEVKPPFLRIGDGIIQHFSHEHHHLKLEENAGRDYDENKQCQACVMPIYFNNYYSCMQCEFILHEACANLSRKMHHPIHPHMLTLVGGYDRVIIMKAGIRNYEISCSACPWLCTAGLFYECDKEGCRFKVHVQCATISEPLDHESHMHPLFLTSKPGENRRCSICGNGAYPETFNCIDCDFSLCFYCATLPQTVRYKHDKHMLSLSYGKGKETSTYWCEACENKISPKAGFYMCDEYCCVNLHIGCLIGKDFYVKPGASLVYNHRKVGVLPNNQHMSRPFCAFCEDRCPYKIVFQRSGLIFCSITCMYSRIIILDEVA